MGVDPPDLAGPMFALADWSELGTPLVLGVEAFAVATIAFAGRLIRSRLNRLAIGIAALLALLVISAILAIASEPAAVWAPPLVLAAVAGSFLATRSPGLRRAAGWAARPSLQWGMLLFAGVGLMGWDASRDPVVHAAPQPEPDDGQQIERARAMGSLEEVFTPVARTDAGTRVHLCRMPAWALTPSMLHSMEIEMARDWGTSLQVIRTRPPDGNSDCHGWVFAGGNFWVMGADVEAILRDNGYQAVAEPGQGDLVIYRQASGQITHSGVVFAAGGRPILIESKWAWLGTYLHAPEAHPYGGLPTYYHSARTSHRLRISP